MVGPRSASWPRFWTPLPRCPRLTGRDWDQHFMEFCTEFHAQSKHQGHREVLTLLSTAETLWHSQVLFKSTARQHSGFSGSQPWATGGLPHSFIRESGAGSMAQGTEAADLPSPTLRTPPPAPPGPSSFHISLAGETVMARSPAGEMPRSRVLKAQSP